MEQKCDFRIGPIPRCIISSVTVISAPCSFSCSTSLAIRCHHKNGRHSRSGELPRQYLRSPMLLLSTGGREGEQRHASLLSPALPGCMRLGPGTGCRAVDRPGRPAGTPRCSSTCAPARQPSAMCFAILRFTFRGSKCVGLHTLTFRPI